MVSKTQNLHDDENLLPLAATKEIFTWGAWRARFLATEAASFLVSMAILYASEPCNRKITNFPDIVRSMFCHGI